uniref:Uncharacterized protein n=1 Tax=Picea sitchensis TaxID=3332 RepID=D5ACG7_PICSI|nr:unknown [Picea sitchensis]
MPIEERKRLSQEVREFTMGDISQFMESLPRDLLTVLRTDLSGLLRSIISKLGAPQRVRLLANAKYAVAGLVPKYNSESGLSLKPTAKATFDYIYLRLCLEALDLHYKMRSIYASLLQLQVLVLKVCRLPSHEDDTSQLAFITSIPSQRMMPLEHWRYQSFSMDMYVD